jgi:hypothetical protein
MGNESLSGTRLLRNSAGRRAPDLWNPAGRPRQHRPPSEPQWAHEIKRAGRARCEGEVMRAARLKELEEMAAKLLEIARKHTSGDGDFRAQIAGLSGLPGHAAPLP